MCSGALRYYLQDEHALPDTPLIAMVPVSMRSEDDADSGGNQVGALLCNLATDVEDPAKRLETISASMRGNKKVFSELPRLQAYALSAALIAPLGLSAVPGFVSTAPPPFNIVISNVPGPTRADVLGWRPARRQLPAVDRAGRAGAEHHHGQQRRTTSISVWSDAGAACRTCSDCSATWKPHSRIWNARSASDAVPKLSAGLLLYRVRDGVVEVLIAHPGGPFWARKDDGAWSIPKGEYDRRRRPLGGRAARVRRRGRVGAARPARGSTWLRSSNPAARSSPRSRCRATSTSPTHAATPSSSNGQGAQDKCVNSPRSIGWSGSRSAQARAKLLKSQRALLDQLMAHPSVAGLAGGLTGLAYLHNHADAAHTRRPLHRSTRIPLHRQSIAMYPTMTAGRCGWPGCKTARPTPTRC